MSLLDKLPGISGVVKGALDPILENLDKYITSAEERGQLRKELYEAQAKLSLGVLQYETSLAEAQRDVVVAEAQGQSWIQRNWRPITMLVFVSIIAWNYILVPIFNIWFGLPILEIPAGMWTLLTVGLGGYVAGRSGEKIVATLTGKQLDFSKGKGGK